jgi:hypothetical protein
MPSTLAWLDHDTSARERTKRILALFGERGTQDQLGLGGIRDSYADLLFPGTSTIQTRLRYFLFVPWIYTHLEQEQVPSRRVAGIARDRELALVEPLLSIEEEGVFGRTAGGALKRLPSEVYWGGLGSWGIRRFAASREQYHRAIDEVYRRRKLSRAHPAEGTENAAGVLTWHPELPPPPVTFPEQATLDVTREEAEFLRDRIVGEHRGSLLAWLALHPTRTDIEFVWQHPLLPAMPPEHRRTVDHARRFSEVMHGAPILYNLQLSEEAKREDMVVEYRTRFAEWAESLDTAAIAAWPVDELFAIARAQGGHTITPHAEEFVRGWVRMVWEDPAAIVQRADARQAIRRRETLLKGARSLFTNRRALEERYRGDLGTGRLVYRWTDVQVLLNDLDDGLGRS